MRIQAEVSLYPLRTGDLSEPIDAFCRFLRHDDVKVDPGAMSTLVAGNYDDVFAAIKDAFARAANEYQVVMMVKLSNACPERRKEES